MEAFNQSTIFAIINLLNGQMKTDILKIKKKKNGRSVNEDRVGKPKSMHNTQKFVLLKGITFFSKPRRDENCRICIMYD